MGSELVKPDHLDRKAVVYVRQSTPHQVITNQESLKLQYALSQRARDLGWREADIDVIDSDLGQSGAAASGPDTGRHRDRRGHRRNLWKNSRTTDGGAFAPSCGIEA